MKNSDLLKLKYKIQKKCQFDYIHHKEYDQKIEKLIVSDRELPTYLESFCATDVLWEEKRYRLVSDGKSVTFGGIEFSMPKKVEETDHGVIMQFENDEIFDFSCDSHICHFFKNSILNEEVSDFKSLSIHPIASLASQVLFIFAENESVFTFDIDGTFIEWKIVKSDSLLTMLIASRVKLNSVELPIKPPAIDRSLYSFAFFKEKKIFAASTPQQEGIRIFDASNGNVICIIPTDWKVKKMANLENGSLLVLYFSGVLEIFNEKFEKVFFMEEIQFIDVHGCYVAACTFDDRVILMAVNGYRVLNELRFDSPIKSIVVAQERLYIKMSLFWKAVDYGGNEIGTISNVDTLDSLTLENGCTLIACFAKDNSLRIFSPVDFHVLRSFDLKVKSHCHAFDSKIGYFYSWFDNQMIFCFDIGKN